MRLRQRLKITCPEYDDPVTAVSELVGDEDEGDSALMPGVCIQSIIWRWRTCMPRSLVVSILLVD
ncbi:hypothetical protein PC116_g14021 [Phytophthora cactorum]|uniref:Uncharacterized protein n=1 Tax=Phytophthora cactorum TaxID=29920 RepID=A0A8T1KMB9_9STRA|nr:hypothetical protein Pcac1_g9557 [Phytophthora cactorum]KAG2888921.1 hypothetical protein PC114_g18187 [Phytophthora cactorum]KAG2916187.1 hypothetical protein PC117_g17801 [Phytophthora cactorum]KAG3016682.1 hypothetical protein PC120_g11462 [Phytophthora cactorum]KAG3173722.1 hypothetical protein C6341_g9948 [Phytophthora cactorum]